MINFILGLIIGGLIGMGIMCLLQINRDNKAQRRIYKAIEYMNSEEFFMKMNNNSIQPPPGKYVCQDYFEAKEKLVEILGGDVDDE